MYTMTYTSIHITAYVVYYKDARCDHAVFDTQAMTVISSKSIEVCLMTWVPWGKNDLRMTFCLCHRPDDLSLGSFGPLTDRLGNGGVDDQSLDKNEAIVHFSLLYVKS